MPVDIGEKTIRVRVRTTGEFQEGTFRTIDIDTEKGIQAVVGRLKGKESMTAQTYIFNKEKWDAIKAEAWVKNSGQTVKYQEGILAMDEDAMELNVPEGILSFTNKSKIEDREIATRGIIGTDIESGAIITEKRFKEYAREELSRLLEEGSEIATETVRKISYNLESKKIKENQQTDKAQRRHRFKAATWTHKNGHPRCILCGDDETVNAYCEGLKARKYKKGGNEGRVKKFIEFMRCKDGCKGNGDCGDVCLTKSAEKQIVYGEVYSPNEVDSQDDTASAEEIEKAAHTFMIDYQKTSVQHSRGTLSRRQAVIVESFIAPQDLTYGGAQVKKGSWVMATKIMDADLWAMIKAGKLTGYSLEGRARRE